MSETGSDIYTPWKGEGGIEKSLLTEDRLYVLRKLLMQVIGEKVDRVKGEVWECGVYQGGTLKMIAEAVNGRRIVAGFDTFAGMPMHGAEDNCHRLGDFCDTSLTAVQKVVGEGVKLIDGEMPGSFKLRKGSWLSFVHVDVDLYASTKGVLEFVWPRMDRGGVVVVDDYGFERTLGARKAVDELFPDALVLATGQAVMIA